MTLELNLARSLAHDAGAIMRQHFRLGIEHRSKADGSPVTAADEAINELVITKIRAHFPDDGVIGEERSEADSASGRVWVCDPVDGTLPFTLGMPTNMFSLALVEDGDPVLGVLYDPYLDRLYQAVRGEGAQVNGTPLRVSEASLPDGLLSIPDFSFGLTDNAALAADVLHQGVRIIAFACITYVGAMVAAGQIAGCVFPGTTVWDIAALKIVVEEAGGRVTDLDGRAQRYDQPLNGALISNGRVHDDLLQLAARHRNPRPAQ